MFTLETDLTAKLLKCFPEADLGMFSMFGRTGAPYRPKRGPHKRTSKFFAT